jgi:hypothetical protein
MSKQTYTAPPPAVNPEAARSVHLKYLAPEGTLFLNEVTVEESVTASYFMACGFQRGYFGIQQLGDDSGRILFSVWDPTDGHDPNAVQDEDRVEVLSHGDGVIVKRFGGEGTGGQSFWSYDWKLGHTYKFLVEGRVEGDKTIFSGYFFVPERGGWQHLATFRTKTGGAPLQSYYSFVEDFRRDGASAEEIRRARFGNGWVKTLGGEWVSLTRAQFTADGNTQLHINAGVSGDGFSLQTGGATKNVTPLRSIMERTPAGVDLPAQPDSQA